jgi:hypothetical protein
MRNDETRRDRLGSQIMNGIVVLIAIAFVVLGLKVQPGEGTFASAKIIALSAAGVCILLAVVGYRMHSVLTPAYGLLFIGSLSATAYGAAVLDPVAAHAGWTGLVITGCTAPIAWLLRHIRQHLAVIAERENAAAGESGLAPAGTMNRERRREAEHAGTSA